MVVSLLIINQYLNQIFIAFKDCNGINYLSKKLITVFKLKHPNIVLKKKKLPLWSNHYYIDCKKRKLQ